MKCTIRNWRNPLIHCFCFVAKFCLCIDGLLAFSKAGDLAVSQRKQAFLTGSVTGPTEGAQMSAFSWEIRKHWRKNPHVGSKVSTSPWHFRFLGPEPGARRFGLQQEQHAPCPRASGPRTDAFFASWGRPLPLLPLGCGQESSLFPS